MRLPSLNCIFHDTRNENLKNTLLAKFSISSDTTKPAVHFKQVWICRNTGENFIEAFDFSSVKKTDIVIFYEMWEAWPRNLQLFSKFLEEANIPFDKSRIYFANESVCNVNGKIVIKNHLRFTAIDSWLSGKLGSEEHDFADKTRVFLSFNRAIRSHRAQLIAELKLHDVIDHGLVSFYTEGSFYDGNPKVNAEDELRKCFYISSDDKRKYDGLVSKDYRIDEISKDTYYYHHIAEDSSARKNSFKTTMFSVVTETHCWEDEIFFTEKIYAAIAECHPFLLVSTRGSLAALRKMGFKTFGEIFDESYDEIECPSERTKAVANEVAKFCNLSVADKRAAWSLMHEIAKHNYRHFINHYTGNLDAKFYFSDCYNTLIPQLKKFKKDTK